MGRRKSEKPKRNAVAVRFDDEELEAVEKAVEGSGREAVGN